MTNSRLSAVKALARVRKDRAYSNLVLDDMLKNLKGSDVSFSKRLFSGTLEKQYKLEYILAQYTNTDNLPEQVVCAILVGMYQLMYMNSVPAFSAINESVNITKALGYRGLSGLVNATLRKLYNKKCAFKPPQDSVEAISVEYSVPKKLVEYWIKSYGMENAMKILEGSVAKAPIFLAVNTMKMDRDALASGLLCSGAVVTNVYNMLRVDSGDPRKMYGFERGAFFVQDLSAAMAVEALAPAVNDSVLDVCAAPGGKSFAAAIRMNGTGSVLAMDIHEHRIKLVESGAKRLGLENISTKMQDASKYNENLGIFDKVICDVPCSGYGTLRRKPEVRYKSLEACKELPSLQFDILNTSVNYLKPGGKILYSTCTLNPLENEFVALKAQRMHNMELVVQNTIFPQEGMGDGFYYCVMKKPME